MKEFKDCLTNPGHSQQTIGDRCLGRLSNTVESTHALITNLESRLNPILATVEKADKEGDPGIIETFPPYFNAIRNETNILESANHRLEKLLTIIEL